MLETERVPENYYLVLLMKMSCEILYTQFSMNCNNVGVQNITFVAVFINKFLLTLQATGPAVNTNSLYEAPSHATSLLKSNS